jgi:Dolichyl-phosphate-mannose-protein mannosyltransferase
VGATLARRRMGLGRGGSTPPIATRMTSQRSRVGPGLTAAALLLGALGLRLWGIGFSPSNPYGRPDEEIFIREGFRYFGAAAPVGVLSSGWPQGFFRIVYLLERLELSALQAWEGEPVHLACAYLLRPLTVSLLPRLFSALAGTLACVFVGLIARRVVPVSRQRSAFMFGIAALGGNYLAARDAHFGVSDATLLLCVTLCLYFAIRALLDHPSWLLPAAMAAGAGFGIKYAAAPLVVPCAVAGLGCFFRHRERRLTVAAVCTLAPLAALAAFAALSPGAVTHWKATLSGLGTHQVRFSADGVHGFLLDPQAVPPPGWLFHLTVTYPAAFGVVGFSLALLGLAACRGDRWSVATLWAATLALFAVIAPVHALFVRYASPVLPSLAVGLAVSLSWIWEGLQRFRWRGMSGALGVAACLGLMGLAFVPPLRTLVAFDRLLARPDTREQAADWILSQGPGATLVTQGLYGEIHALEAGAWEACAPLVPSWLRRRVPQMPDQQTDWARRVHEDSSHWADLVADATTRYLPEASPPASAARFVAQGHAVLDCGRSGRVESPALNPSCFARVAEFSPGLPSCRDKVDLFDSFYIPFAAFDGVEWPGPEIVLSRNTCFKE